MPAAANSVSILTYYILKEETREEFGDERAYRCDSGDVRCIDGVSGAGDYVVLGRLLDRGYSRPLRVLAPTGLGIFQCKFAIILTKFRGLSDLGHD